MTTTYKWIVAVCLVLMAALFLSSPSISRSLERVWSLEDMNDQINETNFVVGDWCSATLVDRDRRLLVTAEHCIADNVTIVTDRVELPNGRFLDRTREVWLPLEVSQNNYDVDNNLIRFRKFRAEIRGYDAQHDVAILQIDDTPQATFAFASPLSTRAVIRGEPAWAVGNPLMIEAVVSQGIIGSTNYQFSNRGRLIRAIVFMFAIRGGSSGGALYNRYGEIIGITNWLHGSGAPALASPVENVFALLDKIYPKKVASK